MPTKPVTLRLPEELLDEIDAQVQSTGTNRNQVVVKALQQVFAFASDETLSEPDSNVLKRLEALERQIATMVDQLGLNFKPSLTERASAIDHERPSQRQTVDAAPAQPQRQSKRQPKAAPATEPPPPPIAQPPAGSQRQTKRQPKAAPARETNQIQVAPPPPAPEPRQTKRKTASKSAKAASTQAPPQPKGRGSVDWLTVKEAYEWLGGDPDDPDSQVTSSDGTRSVKFNRFRVLSASDYQAFGLEFRPDRRRRRQPCLRPTGRGR